MNRRQAALAAVLAVALVASVPIGLFAAPSQTQLKDTRMETESGLNLRVTETHAIPANAFVNDTTINLGAGYLTANGSSSVAVESSWWKVAGDFSRVHGLNVTNAPLYINPDDKPKARISGSNDGPALFSYRDVNESLGDDDVDVSVIIRAGGSAQMVLYGLPDNQTITAFNDDNYALTTNTTTENGTLWLNIAENDPGGTLTSEGTNFDLYLRSGDPDYKKDPSLKDLKPSGRLTFTPTRASVNVTDPEFPGDTVTVEFFLNGAKVGTETAEDNQTVSTDFDLSSGGTHTIEAVATDRGGNRVTLSETFSLNNTLWIRNESNVSQLVDANVTLRYYGEDKIIKENNTGGQINLSDFPEEEKFVVTANDQDGDYYQRSTIIVNDGTPHNMFLLPQNETAVEVRFTLTDYTGNYPVESTELHIQRALPRNDTEYLKWRTIAADFFGVNGYTVWLKEDVRHRLILKNQQGDKRILNAFTPRASETVELKPEGATISVNDSQGPVAWDAYRENVTGTPRIVFEYIDEERITEDINLTIYEQDNSSNKLVETTISGPLGETQWYEPLYGDDQNKTWVVVMHADRGDEGTESGQKIIGFGAENPIPGLPLWMMHGSATAAVVMTGAVFSKFNKSAGAVTVALIAGGFWFVGWLPAAAGAGATLALFFGAVWKMATRGS